MVTGCHMAPHHLSHQGAAMSGWCDQERPAHEASQALPAAFEEDKVVSISRRLFFLLSLCSCSLPHSKTKLLTKCWPCIGHRGHRLHPSIEAATPSGLGLWDRFWWVSGGFLWHDIVDSPVVANHAIWQFWERGRKVKVKADVFCF